MFRVDSAAGVVIFLMFAAVVNTQPPPLDSLAKTTNIFRRAALLAAGHQGKNAARLFVVGGENAGGRREVDAFYVPVEPAGKVVPLTAQRWEHGAATVNGLIYAV